MSDTVRPFDATAQVLADLMQQRGFRVSRGTYHHVNGEMLPTWVIDRPDTAGWNGVWQPWDFEPEMIEDSEAQTLLELCGLAMQKWNEVAGMYAISAMESDWVGGEAELRAEFERLKEGSK